MSSKEEVAPKAPASAPEPKENPIPIKTSQHVSASKEKPPDSLNTEFIYYSSTLKTLAPALSSPSDRKLVIPWLDKLFGPEYHSTHLRAKRNQYLLKMTLMLMNDEVIPPFTSPPPDGALPELQHLTLNNSPLADWERDTMWQDTINDLPQLVRNMKCKIHERCPQVEDSAHCIMDEEFQYYLYLIRPYASLMSYPDEKSKVATWLQVLCTIQTDACPMLKGIRNDYIQALLGCVQNLRVSGPFEYYPPRGTLRSLGEAAYIAAQKQPAFTDPTSKPADAFLRQQPVPENGAFCYIIVTGDLQECQTTVPLSFLPGITGPY